jgi:hypothetical protein
MVERIMAEKKSFLLRMDAHLLEQLKRWADADLRSLNGQIEYLLRRALAESGRPQHPPAAASAEPLDTAGKG